MRKGVSLVLSVLLIVSILSGCCLQHSWQDADCKNPKTCTKCSKTEGESLGHEWTEADCETPKTCAKCGETEGDALGHTESVHTITDTETMECVCLNCGTVFAEPLDIHVVVSQQLVGKWVVSEESANSADANDYFQVNADGTLNYTIRGESGTGSWALKNSIVDEMTRNGKLVYLALAQIQLTMNGRTDYAILPIPPAEISNELSLFALDTLTMERE